ncbi:MAG: hypothetical protein Q8Q28_00960 [Pseudomonadota bacterium]|nr:hypothetical protein [Pseudomonadota bacterium]
MRSANRNNNTRDNRNNNLGFRLSSPSVPAGFAGGAVRNRADQGRHERDTDDHEPGSRAGNLARSNSRP